MLILVVLLKQVAIYAYSISNIDVNVVANGIHTTPVEGTKTNENHQKVINTGNTQPWVQIFCTSGYGGTSNYYGIPAGITWYTDDSNYSQVNFNGNYKMRLKNNNPLFTKRFQVTLNLNG